MDNEYFDSENVSRYNHINKKRQKEKIRSGNREINSLAPKRQPYKRNPFRKGNDY